MSERRPACTAHAPDMDEGKDEDDVRPASRKEPGKEQLSYLWFLQDRRQLHQCEKVKDLQYGRTQLSHCNVRYQKTRANVQKMTQFSAEKLKVKPYATS